MPDCGVHCLRFAFVCFLSRYTPPFRQWICTSLPGNQNQRPRAKPAAAGFAASAHVPRGMPCVSCRTAHKLIQSGHGMPLYKGIEAIIRTLLEMWFQKKLLQQPDECFLETLQKLWDSHCNAMRLSAQLVMPLVCGPAGRIVPVACVCACWCGVVWRGVAWRGVVWCGVVWCGVGCGVWGVGCGVWGLVWCAEGAVTRRQWPGCLPTGTGKRAGLCVLCARCVLVCCCIAGPVHTRTWPALLCRCLCAVTQGLIGPLHRACHAAPSVLSAWCRTAWCSALHCTVCALLHCCCGQRAVGSGTPATHCLTAWGQWAVQLLQCTASLPGGSG